MPKPITNENPVAALRDANNAVITAKSNSRITDEQLDKPLPTPPPTDLSTAAPRQKPISNPNTARPDNHTKASPKPALKSRNVCEDNDGKDRCRIRQNSASVCELFDNLLRKVVYKFRVINYVEFSPVQCKIRLLRVMNLKTRRRTRKTARRM